MISILFVCLGNICRSPLGEAIFRAKAQAHGLNCEVDSAGLIDYHAGELADPRMRRHAAAHGYSLTHRSRPIEPADFARFDFIVAMDAQNRRGILREEERARSRGIEVRAQLLMAADFLTAHTAPDVPDPYYGDADAFEWAIELLEDACNGLLDHIGRAQ